MRENQAAVAEARRLIDEALAQGASQLSLAGLRLRRLPEGLAKLAPALTSLDLSGCWALESVDALARLLLLRDLKLSECGELRDLGPLSGLSQLQSLNLSWCGELRDLEALSGLSQLQSLDLSGCGELRDLGPLSGLSQLQSLDLSGCGELRDLGPLSGLSQLQSLDLSQCGELCDLGPLSGLSQLQSLDLIGCGELRDLWPLSSLSQLQSLNLSWCRELRDLWPLSSLSQLQSLNLSWCGELRDLEALSGLSQLQGLDLSGCREQRDLGRLLGLSQLQSLNLSWCGELRDLGPLSGLSQLQSLDLNRCGDLRDLGPLSGLSQLQSLDLSGCGELRDLGALSGLSQLQSLDLSGCGELRDLGPLSDLSQLQSLDLSRCGELRDLGPLSGLSQLQSLDLSGCGELRDLGPLSGLNQLQSLDLSRCGELRDLGLLSGLSQLQSLDLSWCGELRDLGPLSGLSQLQSLNLVGCGELRDLGPLSGLSQLQSLNLVGCGELRDLGPLSGLSQLQSLYLGGCGELRGLGPLSGLSQLQSLNLSGCGELRDLGPLSGLSQLNSLLLGGCEQVVDISALAALPQLRELAIDGSARLQSPLELLLSGFPRLHGLSTNRLPAVPRELQASEPWDSCLTRLEAWAHDLSAAGAIEQRMAKVFVLGNGCVGKTQIARRLAGEPFDPGVPSTHGVQIRRFALSSTIDAMLWDFGGQDVYLGTHSLFLDDRAVYLAVWTPESESGFDPASPALRLPRHRLGYWLDYVATATGGKAPVLVVQSQCDTESAAVSPAIADPERFTLRLQPLHCSARNEDGLDALLPALRGAAKLLLERYGEVVLPRSWLAVAEALRARREAGERVLQRADYDALCAQQTVGGPGTLLGYLHQAGEVFWQPQAFGGAVVLDQAWALEGVYSLLHREKVIPKLRSRGGVFDADLLASLAGWETAQHSEADRRLFLEMMQTCRMCFKLPSGDYLALDWLPERSAREPQIAAVWRGAEPQAHLQLRYRFLHDGIARAVLSALGEHTKADAVYWRWGACFFDTGTGAVLKLDIQPSHGVGEPVPGVVDLMATGRDPAALVAQVADAIERSVTLGAKAERVWLLGAAKEGADSRRHPSQRPEEPGEEPAPFAALRPGPLAPEIKADAPAQAAAEPVKWRVLVLATEWASRHGGLSTFNRLLCRALAARADTQVVCVCSELDEADMSDARGGAVTLMAAPDEVGAAKYSGLGRRLNLPAGWQPNVVVGHGRVTGSYAKAQVADHSPGARRVQFVHVAPGELEWFKGKPNAAQEADARERIEAALAGTADVVAAVGPRLQREFADLLRAQAAQERVMEFEPALVTEGTLEPPALNHCLLLGRVEDAEIKGLELAARAVGAVRQRGEVKEPELVVRGAPAGQGTSARNTLQAACPGVAVRVREYGDAEAVQADLRRCALMLMPSKREGFGLVALEALALGVPVLVSEASGMADFLRRHAPELMKHFVLPVDGDDEEALVGQWADKINGMLLDEDAKAAAFARTRRLRDRLVAATSWDRSVDNLLGRLDAAKVSP
ncbi:leucine-rich repeat domain-containing protein [Roseateles sp. DXS20W]|uniref:Leucine-rich repeat domain-containing protein n=1 Tax=Pelomonas lactea TaxID=3299030 RepID=A0ABW7GRB3_9BURK